MTFPIKAMIPSLSCVFKDRLVLGDCLLIQEIGKSWRTSSDGWILFQPKIELLDITGVMFAIMKGQGFLGNVWLKSIERIREWLKFNDRFLTS